MAKEPAKGLDDRILSHLVAGWAGFVGLVSSLTSRGTKLDERNLASLEQMASIMNGVIRQQKGFGGLGLANFSHSGKFGDLIYALPAIKSSGGGRLTITWRDDCGLGEKEAANVIPLLDRQPYIAKAVFGLPPKRCRNLDDWRGHYDDKLNLADMVSSWLNQPLSGGGGPWLSVDQPESDEFDGGVVFSRSQRYRDDSFPWGEVAKKFPDAGFIGTDEEYVDFQNVFGSIGRVVCEDLLKAAEVISVCRLFVGNQSCLRAIAEGLKVPVFVETYAPMNNTVFERPNAWYWPMDGIPEA